MKSEKSSDRASQFSILNSQFKNIPPAFGVPLSRGDATRDNTVYPFATTRSQNDVCRTRIILNSQFSIFNSQLSILNLISSQFSTLPPSLLSPSSLRLRKRRQNEGIAKALRENWSETGHFPTVFECKDSAE